MDLQPKYYNPTANRRSIDSRRSAGRHLSPTAVPARPLVDRHTDVQDGNGACYFARKGPPRLQSTVHVQRISSDHEEITAANPPTYLCALSDQVQRNGFQRTEVTGRGKEPHHGQRRRTLRRRHRKAIRKVRLVGSPAARDVLGHIDCGAQAICPNLTSSRDPVASDP